jgi:hypothetical protein
MLLLQSNMKELMMGFRWPPPAVEGVVIETPLIAGNDQKPIMTHIITLPLFCRQNAYSD